MQYDANIPQTNNVELSATRINGIVVQPGQIFSFSFAILECTQAKGYVVAPIYISGTVGEDFCGGVCQVSYTLHVAMRNDGMLATERYPHSLLVTYLLEEYDAAIAGTSKRSLKVHSCISRIVTVTLILQ